jgi:hypothetical protein
MNWSRALVYGVALWAVPFALSFVIFGLRADNRALFESLITVVGVASAVVATLAYLRDGSRGGVIEGIGLGLVWAAISIVIDLPIFLLVFKMSLGDYAADIALSYLSFPIITTGMTLAKGR